MRGILIFDTAMISRLPLVKIYNPGYPLVKLLDQVFVPFLSRLETCYSMCFGFFKQNHRLKLIMLGISVSILFMLCLLQLPCWLMA